MSAKSPLYVTSEIGKLRKVLLHRPGKEIESFVPELLERLLFDDIPYLKIAREEHDAFANVLRENGAEVLYLDKLTAEAIKNKDVREKFIDQFLDEGNITIENERYVLKEFFTDLLEEELIYLLRSGVKKKDIQEYKILTLSNMVEKDYPFILNPMPNLYFTRDPFAIIGTGITLNRMKTEIRNRETIFAEYIFKYHPDFREAEIPLWYNRHENTALEGGDVLILSDKVLAIGISQRTDAASIEKVARRIFKGGQPFEIILALKIPAKRAFMHLDTVFTMIDYNKFTIHAEIEGPLKVFSLIKQDEEGGFIIEEEKASLDKILKSYLELDEITLIRCGGDDFIDAGREQWSDGSNTLAIAPGEVVVYSRNYVTNRLLDENGIKIHTIPSSELSRGRGGPRCMSMPLVREDLS